MLYPYLKSENNCATVWVPQITFSKKHHISSAAIYFNFIQILVNYKITLPYIIMNSLQLIDTYSKLSLTTGWFSIAMIAICANGLGRYNTSSRYYGLSPPAATVHSARPTGYTSPLMLPPIIKSVINSQDLITKEVAGFKRTLNLSTYKWCRIYILTQFQLYTLDTQKVSCIYAFKWLI